MTRPNITPETQQFIDYLQSERAQRIIREQWSEYFIPRRRFTSLDSQPYRGLIEFGLHFSGAKNLFNIKALIRSTWDVQNNHQVLPTPAGPTSGSEWMARK